MGLQTVNLSFILKNQCTCLQSKVVIILNNYIIQTYLNWNLDLKLKIHSLLGFDNIVTVIFFLQLNVRYMAVALYLSSVYSSVSIRFTCILYTDKHTSTLYLLKNNNEVQRKRVPSREIACISRHCSIFVLPKSNP